MNLKKLVNYLADESSDIEKKEIEQWIQSAPSNKRYFESLKRLWEIEPQDEIQVDAEKSWNNFKKNYLSQDEEKKSFNYPATNFHKRKKRSNKYFFLNIAAAAALIFIVFLFQNNHSKNSTEQAAKEHFAMQEITTQKGEKIRFKLTDGTRVILNSDSRIKIPSQFLNESREVYLKGEAQFEVTHLNSKPFIVHSNNSLTKVLGTKFLVSAYPSDTDVLVAVTEGKVSMKNKERIDNKDNKSRIVEKGYVGTLHKDRNPLIKKAKDIKKYTGWAEGKLIFDDDSLGEVKKRIERWYDITIVVNDSSLYKRKLTSVFEDEPLEEVLKVTALSLDIGYEREKKKVTFYKNI